MIRRVCIAIVFVLAAAAGAAAQPAVILVRHAERADSGAAGQAMTAADPDLSPAGTARAESLARMLKDAGISAIYTTEFRRTRQTAAPLAKVLGISPEEVPSKDTAGLVRKVQAARGTVLVVGHSNTIPEILQALGVREPVKIGESEFDNLFIVHAGSLLRLRY